MYVDTDITDIDIDMYLYMYTNIVWQLHHTNPLSAT
jgi:hypothetical protein